MTKKGKNTKIIDGLVNQALPNTMFKVELDDQREVLATLKGSLRRRFVRIFPGDRVKVEMTPYDDKRGRIVYKY
jgi:translation initiation factor IF-1